jgi:hypothetical protein
VKSYGKVIDLLDGMPDFEAILKKLRGNRKAALVEFGRTEASIKQHAAAVADDPNDRKLWRGEACLEGKRSQDAITSFRRAIELDKKLLTTTTHSGGDSFTAEVWLHLGRALDTTHSENTTHRSRPNFMFSLLEELRGERGMSRPSQRRWA